VGIVPAWIASRTDVNEALKQGTRGSTGGRSRRLFRQGLIVAELALALVLLAGAGFFVRGMQRLATADAGWRPDGLVTASLSLPFSPKYATDAECQAFYDKLALRMSELPGAQQATLSVSLPIEGFWRSGNIVVEGRAAPQKGKEPLTYYNSVIPGHFSTVGIRLLQGRDFSDADRAGSHAVAIVNESMAKDLWPGESALGKRLRDPDADKDSWLDVVGVVNDVHPTLELFRHSDTPFQLYLPIAQTPSQFTHWLSLAVRSSVPRATVAAALKAAVQQIDPDQPVYAIATARESMAQVTNGLTLVSQILEVFALIGLILSAVGIYGVIAHLVAQRTNEIGIRMALGAQANDVLWMVLGQGMRLAVTGTAIGLACAWALVRVINSLIPAVHGSDPLAVALVASVLVAVALVACWFPARRATHVNPVVALRGD
jgi:putative ABC transport system permease protein